MVTGYDTGAAVLIFGFFHGFGLATKLQDFELSRDGLASYQLLCPAGVHGQHRADDGRLRPDRLPAHRLLRFELRKIRRNQEKPKCLRRGAGSRPRQ
jgi:hypothetical protein